MANSNKSQYRIREGEAISLNKSLPKGYEIIEGTLTEPPGTRWVKKKGEPLFKRDKSGKLTKNPKYEQELVITDEDYFTTRIAEDRVYEPNKAAAFTVDKSLEAKISAKEKRLRKELAKRKEEDAQAVARSKARREEEARAKSKTKAKPTKKDKPKAVASVKSKPATAAKTTTAKPAKQDKPASVPKKPKATTYTVMGKTFATKAEARAYKALQEQKAGKLCEIKESTRKPSHRVVSFTAKSK